jgi:NAD(P)-dependent dehydrogenase (short-subunit alcohol dehydrogenase family)
MAADPSAKIVLITGCASGIGKATAKRLKADGWMVVATARRTEQLAELAAAGCEVVALDVADEASRAQAIDAVLARHGRIDALINNAGYSLSGALEPLPLDAVRRQFETNVFGLLHLCQLVLPAMRRQRSGRIVNLSSMGGKLTFPGGGAYHATKHAVEALSDALRFETAGFCVKVIVIEPGLIRTGFAQAAQKAMIPPAVTTGPYADFDAAVARSTREAYEKGPLATLGGPPERVAEVIATALAARKPRTRYRVTASASLLMGLRRLLSDRQWDGFLRSSFPQPGVA